ncbi:hypothetical protein SLS62_006923 [Diatrype stigma]|uniref:Xylose isomerase-like TIM barrel domain-containing protein n=1 Tax=Diatrype stigma TaxID=117547 RepID=A0AAN9UXL3_9PEZI
MPIEYQGAKVPTSFASCSIGHKESHTFPLKLKAIADAGFDGIELAMTDLLAYGKVLNGTAPAWEDFDAFVEIAKVAREQAKQHNLTIIMLQSFAHLEGWPKGSKERETAFNRARGYMRIMEAAGTDMLQIGSSDVPEIAAASFDDLVGDLAELADIFATKGFRIAYENWCWATHAPDWKDVWRIVEKVDRPNVGLCLDTCQSAGGEWADPTTKSGLIEEEGLTREALEARWRQSLEDLARTVPGDKIYVLQVSDGYRMDPPLENKVNEKGMRPRYQWSVDYRPLPFDGGYLPVTDFSDAVLKTGFRGWYSVEVFDSKAPQKYDDMGEFAKKALSSLEKLLHK